MPLPLWAIPAITAGGQFLSNWIGARHQRKSNMELAKFQADANEKYLQSQLDYNHPKSQMARFQEAGWSPFLTYTQGGPGNQSAPLSYPEIKNVDLQSMMNLAPILNQSALTASQVQAQNAKTRHTYAMTELNKLQQEVLRRNPLLDDGAFKAIIDSLKSTAEIKATESQVMTGQADWFFGKYSTGNPGQMKLQRELELLQQRFDLGTQDQSIKASILKSKEFQNAILEVQKKFMTDGDITPQHVLQFIQLLLMKSL